MEWSILEEMPPGFRFYPTEEELVSFYLPQKLEGRRKDLDLVIPLLPVYDFNPWDLPQFAGVFCRGDPEQWFFFIPRQEKEMQGGRPSRLTESGYWKATGSPGFVYSSSGNYNRIIGEKRTMVFYRGRAPNGEKTEWKMNEYTAIDGEASSSTSTPPIKLRQELTLCRVYVKSKCLRAFDRRPTTGLAIKLTSQLPGPNGEEPSRAISHHRNHPISMIDRRRNSPDDRSSSSSGNHAVNDRIQNMEIDNTAESSNYNDPLWEWEQLNWF